MEDSKPKRRCDDCEYEHGEFCVHPIMKEEIWKTKDRFLSDLLPYIDETPEWCPLNSNLK